MKIRTGLLAICMMTAPTWAQTAAQQGASSQPPQAATKNAAQTPTAAPAPAAAVKKIDPAKEADIRKLLDVLGSKEAALQVQENMVQALQANFQENLPPNDNSQKFIALFVEKFRSKMSPDDLVNETVPIYDKYLSDADIQGMIQFYQSPLGQRLLKVMPKVSQEVGQAGYEHGQKMAEESLNEVLAAHPELKLPGAPAQGKPPEKP